MENNDIELMLKFKEGDISCFEELMNRYTTPLLNFIYRFIGSRSEAEDLTQEVFLRVYQEKDRYEPKSKFSTWLYKIVSDICIDYQRKRKIKTVPFDAQIPTSIFAEKKQSACEIQDLSQLTPDVLIMKKQISETIRTALLSLPEKQRLALELRVYENKSYKEISEILNCSVSAVESLLFRARQLLKKKLDKK